MRNRIAMSHPSPASALDRALDARYIATLLCAEPPDSGRPGERKRAMAIADELAHIFCESIGLWDYEARERIAELPADPK